MDNVTKSPTLAELIAASKAQAAEIEQLKAQLAAKDNNPAPKIEAAIADYSKGTISIRGINRFPVSLFKPQVDALKAYLSSDEFNTWFNSAETMDKLRCAAVAHEFATGLGKEWPKDAKADDPKVLEYKAAYDQGYKAAKADKSLVASPRVKKSTLKTAVVR